MLIKILIVNDIMSTGGTEKLIKDICKYYNVKNIELYIATYFKAEWDKDIDSKVAEHYYFNKINRNSFINKLGKYIFNISQYEVLEDEFDVCIVYKQLCYDAINYVKAKKYILWVHEDYAYNKLYESSNWWKNRIEYNHKKKFLKNYDKIVACSENAKESFEKYYKVKNLIVIKNSIIEIEIESKCDDEIDLPNAIKNNYMINISTLSNSVAGYGKRVDLLIELFSKCLKNDENLKLVIVGSGKIKDELEKLITELGIVDKCFLLGKKDNPYPYIKNAKIMLSTSNAESYGLSIAEAMYLGVPAVCFNNRGISDFVNNGQNGIIVNSNEEFINAVLKINYDNDYRIKLSNNAKDSMKKTANIIGYVNNIEQLVFEVLSGD